MRKLTIVSAAIAATMILAACEPTTKEEAAAPKAEATAEPAAVAKEPAAADAATKPEAAKADAAAEAPEAAAPGEEHTGAIKVAPEK